ncbi:serine/threonine-protein kinase [Cystobacter fuscus]
MSEPEQEERTAVPGEARTVISPRRGPTPTEGERPTPPATGGAGFPMAPGRTLAGRYTVLDVLGQGGMGVVLAAYDARLDRRVALKLVHSREEGRGGDGLAQVRMVREAQSMARLNHPHVVAVYDAGTLEDGAVFIAMEYVQGQTLRSWCQHTPPRPWREVIDAYLDAGRGLAAAHAAGLVHRDFKPDNVLVGEDGRVRVTDFGLARAGSVPDDAGPPVTAIASSAIQAPLTLPGSVMGTPAYMAPELLQGQTANVRSDVYAFCASLHEALHGRVPYPMDSMAAILRLKEGQPPVPPEDSQVPAWVSRAVSQGLHPDPLQRPGSLEQVLRRLEDDPEVRRRTWLRMGGLAASVALLAGLAVWTWGRQQGPGCESLERRLEGVWDAPVKARVTQSLEATGLPYAKDTARRVERLLDGYAQAWVKQRIEVCRWRPRTRRRHRAPSAWSSCARPAWSSGAASSRPSPDCWGAGRIRNSSARRCRWRRRCRRWSTARMPRRCWRRCRLPRLPRCARGWRSCRRGWSRWRCCSRRESTKKGWR